MRFKRAAPASAIAALPMAAFAGEPVDRNETATADQGSTMRINGTPWGIAVPGGGSSA